MRLLGNHYKRLVFGMITSSGIIGVNNVDLLGSGLLLPIVKLSELDDSVCNRIQPINIFHCEVYQTVQDNSTLTWDVNINGTESKMLGILLEHDLGGTGYSQTPKNKVLEFNLTASTHIVHDRIHRTEPILISTLTVHPPINITEPFSVIICGIDHISMPDSISVTVTTTQRELTGIL